MTFDTIYFVLYKNAETSVTCAVYSDFILTNSGLKLLSLSKLFASHKVNFTSDEIYGQTAVIYSDFAPLRGLWAANREICK
jgi:hypothetical protein